MRARIDVSEIEAQTKIRAKYLRALENEEWDLLPGPTFVKSFLRTYAEALGLDGRALVDEYKLNYEYAGESAESSQQPAVAGVVVPARGCAAAAHQRAARRRPAAALPARLRDRGERGGDRDRAALGRPAVAEAGRRRLEPGHERYAGGRIARRSLRAGQRRPLATPRRRRAHSWLR